MNKVYFHPRTGEGSNSIKQLYSLCNEKERVLSESFFLSYQRGDGCGEYTPFVGIKRRPKNTTLGCLFQESEKNNLQKHSTSNLRTALLSVLSNNFSRDKKVNVAVSGGIDSWLLVALLIHEGYKVHGWYLRSDIDGYCEWQQVKELCDRWQITLTSVRTSLESFSDYLHELISITETPIYNLHPVSKLLLAKKLAEQGVTSLVSGDGADQILAGKSDCDLLPLTEACFVRSKVELITPFLSAEVVSIVRESGPWMHKDPAYELANEIGVEGRAKIPTMFPPLRLDPLTIKIPNDSAIPKSATACLRLSTQILLEKFGG